MVAEEYIIGNLIGGIGNQMFIIAATESLALDHDTTTYYIGRTEAQLFLSAEKWLAKLPTKSHLRTYNQPSFRYKRIPYQKRMLLNGYFQSESFFAAHTEYIRSLFAPPKHIKSYL